VRLGQCFWTFRTIIVPSSLLLRIPQRMLGLLNATIHRYCDGSKRGELLVQPHEVMSEKALYMEALPSYTVNYTHAQRVTICCHNTDLVHANGHDRTILVIFSQALYEAP